MKAFPCFCPFSFLAVKNDSFVFATFVFCDFCETLINQDVSRMSLSLGSIISIISDDKDDNDDDTRGEKELRPPRIRATV